ncbi:MAG TPA: hypothetical protein VKD67_12280 [Acidimicrobiales bacterium]|nr:hypothetical protein [Acidimicrobiales bacterium]
MRSRRQNVLVALVTTASFSAVGGFALGVGVLVDVNLLADGLLLFYVYLLARRRRADERRAAHRAGSRAA